MTSSGMQSRTVALASALLFVLSAASADAATYRWAITGADDWDDPSSWSPLRGAPAADDRLVFDQPMPVTAYGVPDQAIGQLVVENGCQLTLEAWTGPPQATLSLTGLAGSDLTVAAGASLTLQAVVPVRLSLPSGTDGRIEGALAIRGGAHRVLATDPHSLVFAAGSSMETGAGMSGNPFGTTALESVTFQAGSLYRQIAGGNPFGAAAPLSVVRFEPGSRYRLDGAVAPSFAGRTYADVEFNVPGTTTITGSNPAQMDSVIFSRGTVDFLHRDIRIRGNIRRVGGGAGGTYRFVSTDPAAKVALVGSTRQEISVPGGLATTFASNVTLEVDNPAGVLLRSSLLIEGTLKFTRGMITSGGQFIIVGAIVGASQTTGWVAAGLGMTAHKGAVTCSLAVGDTLHFLPVVATFSELSEDVSLGVWIQPGPVPRMPYAGSGLDSTRLLSRTWYLSALGMDLTWPGTCDFTLAYHPDDVAPGLDFQSLVMNWTDGSGWHPTTLGAVTSQTIEVLGVGQILGGYDGAFYLGSMSPTSNSGAPVGSRALGLAPSPNPARGATRIGFALPAAGSARLAIADVQGREVALLEDGHLPAGPHEREWRISAATPPGVYFIRLEAAGLTSVRRVVTMR